MTRGVVIIGAGHAGVEVASTLRDMGYAADVTILETDTGQPYQRPPLSKQYLVDGGDPFLLRSTSFFDSHDIDLRLGAQAVSVETRSQCVRLLDGSTVPYRYLILAVGATNRDAAIPGQQLDGVLSVRTLHDAQLLRHRLPHATQVVVIGGGFIGLETAAAAAGVTIIEPKHRVLGRSVSPFVSEVVRASHARVGSSVLLGRSVREMTGRNGTVDGVVLTDGGRIDADLVVVGVGAQPNTALAEEAGIVTDNGVLVDECLRTSDPNVFAIGDCVSMADSRTGEARRIECVQNAVDQARHVAAQIVDGFARPYEAIPYFWTNQLDLRIQIAGVGNTDDELVVLGKPADRAFSVCRFNAGRLIAVESVNRPRDHMAARKLLAEGIPLDAATAAREDFDLKVHLNTHNMKAPSPL